MGTRGGLFFIGLLSAIITIISLNVAFGRSWNYNHYGYGHRYYHCDDRYNKNHNHTQHDKNAQADSSTHNY
jgi:hypothetical protein